MPVRRSHDQDLAALLRVLNADPAKRFRASDLKQRTGVPKQKVRALLEGVSGVTIMKELGSYWFQASAERAP
jgi:hypothetical protein